MLFSVAGSPDADLTAAGIEMAEGATRFTLRRSGEEVTVRTRLLGRHNVANLLAAAAVGTSLDLPLHSIGRALARVSPPAHRLAPIINRQAGIVVIDDSLAPLAPRVVEEISKIAEGPIRFVINTHWHPDHTGGNELLGKSGGVVIAHENVRTRLSEEQFIGLTSMRVPPAAAAALPVVTFDDSVSFYLNGDRLDVVHVSEAHIQIIRQTPGGVSVERDPVHPFHETAAQFFAQPG